MHLLHILAQALQEVHIFFIPPTHNLEDRTCGPQREWTVVNLGLFLMDSGSRNSPGLMVPIYGTILPPWGSR